MDVASAVIGLAMTAVLFPFIALAIKLNSRGPVFYTQRRLGYQGRVFRIVKFRTMRQDAEVNGQAVWARPDDNRITAVGRVLRRLYLDELPQWWNVMAGEMSVVGPRPERPEIAMQVVKEVPRFELRLLVKPGITGLAQTRYKYGNTIRDCVVKFRYDYLYVRTCSAWVDLKILALTVPRILLRRGT
jgi:lipopolysaccharide/colanic/teichoic acid biosynthesis glycosyltransferase